MAEKEVSLAAKDFVARDHELEARHEQASEALAKHRWHWTLDESNPERVSINEYADRVSRSRSSIQRIVKGYAAWVARDPGPGIGPVTLTDFIEQANLGVERAAATEAVAVAKGKTFTAAARADRAEVREVLTTAQDRAARKGTTVSEELPAVAEWREKSRQAQRRQRDERLSSDFRLVEFEGHLGAAIRRLREALSMAREIDFTAEEIELVQGSLENLRTLVKLIDTRLVGSGDIDWDSEFAKAMGD